MLVLQEERPACFTGQSWGEYLGGVRDEARDNEALRRRLERGAMPVYCESCLPEYRVSMEKQGRCEPLKGYERAAEPR
ncbi:hypothetical protein UFOVP703_3 [uncultured Caudovirales phage]|uniref:Uncharacterized protein n=1 Tax=uncultured Caudovirales phage TaxID=2100421 RepID=A0A6J5NMI7_9CAUD|nr:hypothetical protein UFOVP703_3 [uncultured Caudovirales phage]